MVLSCCPDALHGKPNASRNPLKLREKRDVDPTASGRSG
jgi:hypothetical protein